MARGRARRRGLSLRVAAPWKVRARRKRGTAKRSSRVLVIGRRTVRAFVGK